MKKIRLLLFSTIAFSNMTYAQKNAKNILKSTNIQEIEEYIKTTHPDDPKKIVLKPRLIALKNQEWTKGKYRAKPMEKRDLSPSILTDNIAESEEFTHLISSDNQNHTNKTLKLLNTMFDNDDSSKSVILLLKNQTKCNLVLRIQGKNNYTMAIPAKGENFIVINKGDYHLTTNVCNNLYSSNKNIMKGTFILLSEKEEKAESSSSFSKKK